ncbi:MAG: MFS transporter [Pseudonocardiaceae bacterium]
MGSLSLLRANRALRLLWTARTVSYLGDSLSLVALMLYVADATGAALAVAVLLLVGDFAPALLGPLTGTVSDRFDLKRVMVGCEAVQGALVAVVALWLPSLPLLLILVGLRAITGQIFQPASRAAVPALVPDEHLESANAAIGIGTNGGEALGPLLAAVLFPLLGVRGVLLVDAGTFLVSAILLALLRLPARAAPVDQQGSSFWQDTAAGLRYIWAAPLVRTIGLGFFAIVAFNGIDDVALVFLATRTLGGGDSAAGLLLAASGVGLFLGYALLARPHRPNLVALLLTGFAISSAGNLLTGLAWAIGAAFAVQAVRGVGIAAMDVAVNTLLQRSVPPALVGRVFGSLYGAIGVAAALAYVLGGLLLDATNPRVAFLVAGSGGLLATLIVAVTIRRSTPKP